MQSVGKQKTLFSFFGKLTPGSSKSAHPASAKTAKEQKADSNEEKNCTNEESPIKMSKNGQKRRLTIIESDSECESETNIAKTNEPANEKGSPVSPIFPISKRARLSVLGLDNLSTSTPKSCKKTTLEKFCNRSTVSDQSIEVTTNEKHETSECRSESTFEESSYLNEKDNSYFSSFVADDVSFLKESSTQQRFKHLDFEFLKPEKIRDLNRRRPDDADYDARTLFVPESFLKEQTPAHRQWWLMKSQHFDTILFFKVGKFYELYHMDAVVGVKNLNLSFMKGDYAHCGFPEVSFDRFSDQLIEHGFKVARVEQTETPEMLQKRAHQELLPSKEKVIRREICRIITRGTKTYNFLETEDDNVQVSYLAALCEQNSTDKKNQIGICFVNTSVGKISISQFEDDCDYSQLRTVLASYPPVQILFPRGQLSPQMLNMFKYNLNNVDKEALIPKVQFWTAADTLRNLALDCYFGVDDRGNVDWPKALAICIDQQDLFQQTPKPQYALGISSFGAIVWYLKECLIDHDILRLKNFELYSPPATVEFGKLSSCHQPLKNRYMVLNDITLRNLDIVNFERKKSTKVTVYDEINLCKTAMGKRLLHFWLCNPLCDLQEIEQRQVAVRNLIEQAELFESLIKQLREIPDLERLLQKMHSLSIRAPNTDHPECRAVYFEADTYSKRKVADFVQLISGFAKANKLMQTVCNFASQIHSSLLQALFIRKGGAKCFPDIQSDVQYFQNAFDHETAKTIGSIIPEEGVDSALDAANQAIVHAEKQLDNYLKTIQKRLNCSSVQYLNSGRNRYNLEIPESACKNLNHEFDFRSQRKGFKRYTTKELDDLVKLLAASEADREVALKDIMRRLFASFCERKVKWYAAVENIATLDVLLAFAQYAKCCTREVCCPKFIDAIDGKTFLRLDESVHPCCGKIKTQGDYIANDVLIGSSESDTGQVLLLTGANMGGKSTLMRQVGTLIVLAQIGSYVPARNFTLSPVDRIFTRIGARDSLITGQSTLFVELRETSAILKHATIHSFVIIDELGRGTSTWDGTAIAHATLQYITYHIGCRTIFSTHYHSLMDSLAANPRIRLGHMACMVENESEGADPTEENVVFLYKLAPGACPKSYGFNAAKLAGIHTDVIKKAYAKSMYFARMEKERVSQVKEAENAKV
ncbi:DNA mismatch repair protein Msh6 [Trichinella patagoniensis]|uniref:DNA mismatch repair protein n=1 Tax=Trichinella patagoniensis TaxID=990121 RepID=A0A0V0ZM61_9BILA|nr:DNA mismatch repair protein Msh6 [Trichinella patagoniensis]